MQGSQKGTTEGSMSDNRKPLLAECGKPFLRIVRGRIVARFRHDGHGCSFDCPLDDLHSLEDSILTDDELLKRRDKLDAALRERGVKIAV